MTLRKMILLSTVAVAALAYETKGGWKKNAEGAIEKDIEGNPIYLEGDGKETTIAPGYINRLNTEAAQHRTRANDAENKLKAFGDLDPKAAKAAVDKLKDVDFDALVNKGEIETVKTQMREQFESDIREKDEKLADAQKRIERLALDNAFNSSQLLKSRLAVPEDAARATFRDRFKYDAEKGRVVPLTETGDPLINKHGDIASVDEAFETFINARTDKDNWLKAPDASGSGSQGGGGNRGTGNVMKRSDFDALPPMRQAEVGKKVGAGEMQIVD